MFKHLSKHKKIYHDTLIKLSIILNKLDKKHSNFDWMLHAGGALYYYQLHEIDLSDIDIIVKGISIRELKTLLRQEFDITSVNIKKYRRFSKGTYNGRCLEGMFNGITINFFNPLISTTTIGEKTIYYSYSNLSFLKKPIIKNINIAPIEDILIYKSILQRGETDNKRDIEAVTDILTNYKDLDFNYLKRTIKQRKDLTICIKNLQRGIIKTYLQKEPVDNVLSTSLFNFRPNNIQIKNAVQILSYILI